MTEPQATPPSGFLDSLGARGLRRAEPRTSISLAGGGCALAILGVLIVSGDTGASDGHFNRWPGVILSALVVAAGFFTLSRVRTGAVATAGTVAGALGVPPLMFFLTFDGGDLPPYSTDGILIVSTVVWLAAYTIGPGRGRPFFLGAGLLGTWFTLLQLTEDLFDTPFLLFGFTFVPSDQSFGGGRASSFPSFTTIGALSLALGVGYLLAARTLDRRGFHGTGTPFALAALPTLGAGALFLADELEAAGSGLLLVAIGFALSLHGPAVMRRATTWVGGATAALGAGVFLGDMTDDATIGGMLFLAAGIGLVFAGHAIATARDEPDEMAVTVPVAVAAVAPAAPAPAPPVVDDTTQWAPPDDTPPPPAL